MKWQGSSGRVCVCVCVVTVRENKYGGGHNGQTERSSVQFKAYANYNWVLTGGCSMMTDTQLGELKGLH